MAVLFNALAPVVSHALNADVAQADICTSVSHSDKPMKGMTDCGYCATHAGSFGLAPTAGFALALLDTHDARPFLFYHAPHPLPVWIAPQSRAPPSFA